MQLETAAERVRLAVGSLGAVADLPKAIRELQQQTEQMVQLAGGLTEEYQSLLSELAMQREVSLRLCAMGSNQPSLEYWREKESEIRRELRGEDDMRPGGSAAASPQPTEEPETWGSDEIEVGTDAEDPSP
jgi:hypothetical protein